MEDPRRWLRRAAAFWLGVEASYLALFIVRTLKVQRRTPRRLDATLRRRAFEHTLAEADAFPADMAVWLGGPLATVRRGNLREWLAEAFFSQDWDQLDASAVDELRGYAAAIEANVGVTFAPGFAAGLAPMLTTTSRVMPLPRPLALHALSHGACALIEHIYLRSRGFARYPATARRCVAYWHRPAARGEGGKSENAPTVFVHGIGLGLAAPYLPFLHTLQRELARPGRERELFLPEIRRCRLAPEVGHDIPSEAAVASCFSEMLHEHGHERANWIAHSFGSFVMAWVQRHQPRLLKRLVLVDPCCFLLSNPHTARTVLYQWCDGPNTSPIIPSLLDVGMAYLRSAPRIARTMRRHFCWVQNSMRADELPPETLVVLGGADVFSPVAKVRAYLQRHARPGLEVLWNDGAHHGWPLMTPGSATQRRVIAFVQGEGEEDAIDAV